MPVPTQNLVAFAFLAIIFAGLPLLVARRAGSRAALRSAGWGVLGLTVAAWAAFHNYSDEPLATALGIAASLAAAVMVVHLLRHLLTEP